MSQATPPPSASLTRRAVMGHMGGGLVVAAVPKLAAASGSRPAPDLLMRPIPKTGEVLPAIGLGTFLTFDGLPGQSREKIAEVMRRHLDGGGRVIDTSPLYGAAEINVGDCSAMLGGTPDMFVANKVWATGEFAGDQSHAERSLVQSMQRLWRDQIDVMQCHSLTNLEFMLTLMSAWKKEGRIRYLGATHHDMTYLQPLTDTVERHAVDFVQLHYSIFERRAEQRLLPAAMERGVAVLVNMPLEKGRLHALVGERPLPDFAAELGIRNWAQYFLKWVVSHPGVTCALPATSNPDHVQENLGAMRGPMPDAAMRERMARHVESIPGFFDLDKGGPRSWYPGKSYQGLLSGAQSDMAARLSR